MTAEDETTRSSRDRILIAAAEMIGEDPAARLSVRSVAARAGVSMGSLRFHFPTQRELHDTVLSAIYAHVTPDDMIHDTSLPARDRLVGCLRQVVGLMGVGDEARANWMRIADTFIAEQPTDEARGAYRALVRQGELRIEHWLGVLAAEGALPVDSIERCARFLSIVIDGLGVARALPADASQLTGETETLHLAADAVLSRGA
ncbi:TetR/AcrR family transcriptional regulator [Agrococcus sp. ARC_14]|uniref:TetR/AcrR family transcriptional regulator n=1 Tax=Agrococcus sp. ARC_14 TaxID=2919927 RepID=UPI001F05B7AF|nr:TetR/AcrR family transcriptional regulator [Agrococcus sp. ARC_14]MCH1881747.1 TetR/AcrR family transcriptional regulator [Agrococcus sp. ARC_14]